MAVRTLIRHLQYLWASFAVRVHTVLDAAVKTAGPLYILLALTLMSCIIYIYFTAVLPVIYDLYSAPGIAHLSFSLWLIYNIFFNYFWCIQTDPGSPPLHVEAGTDLSQYEISSNSPQMRWCKRCRKLKPPMTHHCHICKRCVLKMDHHCPWMHNCIGFYNYRYFFVFLLYLWAGCLYSVGMASVPLFGRMVNSPVHRQANGVLFTFVLSLAVLGSVSCLLGWHMYLVLTAQTTIDFYGNRQRKKDARRAGQIWINEFDVGKIENVKNTLDASGGRFWWLTWLLPRRASPKGDGIQFPCRNSGRDTAYDGSQPSSHNLNLYSNVSSSSSRDNIPRDSSFTENDDQRRSDEIV